MVKVSLNNLNVLHNLIMKFVCLLLLCDRWDGSYFKHTLCAQDLMGKFAVGTRIVIDRNSNGLHVGSWTGLLVKMFQDYSIMFVTWRKLLGENKTTFYN